MKKITILLAMLLILTACQRVTEPTNVPNEVEQNTSSQTSADTSSLEGGTEESGQASGKSSSGDSVSGSAILDAPMPDAMPPAGSEALKLPDNLYTSSNGWSLELLTPAQYNIEQYIGRGGYRGYLSTTVFEGIRDGKMTLFNPNGKQISQDGEYDDNTGEPWYYAGEYVSVKKDGRMGIVSASDGKVIVPFEYDYAIFSEETGYFHVEKDKATQLLRESDLSLAYTLDRGDEFYVLGKNREVLYQNSTLKIFDKSGQPIKNLVCDDMRIAAEETDPVGVIRIAFKDGNKWGLLDEDGELITNPVYDDFNPTFVGDYITYQKTGKWGIMDYTGKVTVKPRWDDIIIWNEHSASFCLNNKWTGTTDLDRDPEVTEPIYDFVGPYSASDGYASFQKGEKWGLLDDGGNVVMTPRHSGEIRAGVKGFDSDVFLVSGQNGPGSAGVFVDGQLVIPTDHIIYPMSINHYAAEDEPYNLVWTPAGKWGYIDSRGQYVIDAKFEEADGFFKGRDVAMVKYNGKICLIDRKGNVVLETVFDDCGAINPDTFVASMRYTDEQGNSQHCLVRLVKN